MTVFLQGFELALDAGAKEVAIVASASEAFSQWDSNCSIAESLARFEHLVKAAREAGVAVRGYVSCATGCPYQVLLSLGLTDTGRTTLRDMFDGTCLQLAAHAHPQSVTQCLACVERTARNVPFPRVLLLASG